MNTQVDPLAVYRHQVEEAKSTKPKMSDAAVARLREISEQEKLAAAKAEEFKSMLRSVMVTPANLRKLSNAVIRKRLSARLGAELTNCNGGLMPATC